jgi:hypothetical protein
MVGYGIVSPGVEEFIRGLTTDAADAEWRLAKLAPQPVATESQPIRTGPTANLRTTTWPLSTTYRPLPRPNCPWCRP